MLPYEQVEKKLLNFAHHYEFEQSGLKIGDLKKLITIDCS
jgi:hypothetical protein